MVLLSRRRRAEMLLQSAGIRASWGGAPSVEDIRKLDQERLLQSPFLTEDLSDDDMAMAKALLAERSAEDIAAALVRMYRSHLPAAEEVFDPGAGAAAAREPREFREPRGPREPRAEKHLPGQGVWFRLNVGRLKNADPRWLIPMICRQGKITKQEIGMIRILERETRIEIDAQVAERFAAAVALIERAEVRIEPLGTPPAESGPGEPRKAKAGDHPARPAIKERWKTKQAGWQKKKPN